MPMNAPEYTTGFYGKLPSEGDFVTRHLPWSFTEPWDKWMQQAMARARSDLGERWHDLYMSCPVWRFLLGPDICGKQAWIGLWFASVDRVGRQFPLTVARPLPCMPTALDTLVWLGGWLDALEDVALTALEPATRADELAARLAHIPAPELPTASARGTIIAVPARYSLDAAPWPPQGTLPEEGSGHAVWYCNGTEDVVPRLRVTAGLPEAGAFCDFVDLASSRTGA